MSEPPDLAMFPSQTGCPACGAEPGEACDPSALTRSLPRRRLGVDAQGYHRARVEQQTTRELSWLREHPERGFW